MPSDTPTPDRPADRQSLRRQLRLARRALPPAHQRQAAQALDRRLHALPGLRRARHVGAYVATDGEIDPGVFIARLLRRGACAWLPVLATPQAQHPLGMCFARHPARWRCGQRPRAHRLRRGWRRNRFGLLEPRNRTRRAAWTLDVLLLPLVGFDAHGQRLGMGGGFYDRLLADFATRPRRPRLLGLAHDLQQVDVLPVAAWDQPVDAVMTPTRQVRAAQGASRRIT